MIDKELFKKIINTGVSVTEYLLLYYLNTAIDIKDVIINKRILGVFNLLIGKGYVIKTKEGILITNLGQKILSKVGNMPTEVVNVVKIEEEDDYYTSLLNCLKRELKSLIGKEQIKGFGNVYFIPTETELKDHLKRFWKKYPKYKDLLKIKQVLLEHINNCISSNNIAPAIKYYIIKDASNSRLASAYDDFDSNVVNTVKKINTKNLF